MAKDRELIDDIVHSFNKVFGEGSAVTLDSPYSVEVPGWISTGCSLLDNAIGTPGIPLGRITSISGKPSTGKTTIINHLLANVQKMGGVAVLFDTEYSYDVRRARRIGVTDDLIISQPGTIEECFGRMMSLINYVRSKQVDIPMLIAWDTVSATPTDAEIKGGDSTKIDKIEKGMRDPYPMSSHSKAVSMGLRKIVKILSKEKVAVVLVNQFKTSFSGWGSKRTYIAKLPIFYHSSLSLDVTLGGTRIEEEDKPVGITTKVFVSKNKMASPFNEAVFPIRFEDGIDDKSALLDLAIQKGLITAKGGGWLDFGKKSFRRNEWKNICTEDVYNLLREQLFKKGVTN